MKNNLELILLVGNWVVVAIQAFTIFLYGNSIGLFIIMLLALIVQVLGVYDNRKKEIINILTYKMCIKRIVNRRGASLSTPV